MKEFAKRPVALLLIGFMLFSCVCPAHAAQPEENSISPMYAVPIVVDCGGNISEDLTLSILCEYSTPSSSGVTRVDITAYVEKRNLLFLWERVDIGRPNDEFNTICYGIDNYASYSAQLPSSGTYRITSIFEVYCGRDLVETIEVTTNNYSC